MGIQKRISSKTAIKPHTVFEKFILVRNSFHSDRLGFHEVICDMAIKKIHEHKTIYGQTDSLNTNNLMDFGQIDWISYE